VKPALLKGGHVVDPSQGIDGRADVLVRDGKIVAVGPNIAVSDETEVFAADGFVVAPGFVDVHVHLREPGKEDAETIATGAMAAAVGGFTSVCAMPNTDPVTDNQAAVGFILKQAREANAARVYPIGAVTVGQRGERLAEIGKMVAAGAVAVSDDGRPVLSSHLMRTALEYAQTFGVPVADHCEDPALAQGGVMHEGLTSTRLGLRGIPAAAEDIMVARDILLAELTGGHVHLCHMSTRGSVELIRRGKERGVRVTAEATPHHFTLTDEACAGYDTHAKMNPPLREAADVRAILEGLADGTIDAVATDHAPHAVQEKLCEFDEAANGIIGLETALSLSLRAGVPIERLVEALTIGPVRALGLERWAPGIGTLSMGAPADLVIFDPSQEWTVERETIASKGKNTPVLGQTLRGVVVATVYEGAVVFEGPSSYN